MNILILTDLSDVAKNAGSYAVQFLRDVPAHFYMLNIELFNPEPDLAQEKKEQALKKLHQRMEELQEISSNRGHAFTALYSENDLVSATRKFTMEKKIDLIVMGAAHKGYSPFTIIGNHSYELIKKIRCNILAVAEHCDYKAVKKMILPIDYNASLNRDIFEIFDRPGVAEGADFSVIEIQDTSTGETGAGKQIFSPMKNRKVEVMPVEGKDIYSETNLKNIQRRFNMFVILGKNLGICERFLHNKHGIYSRVENSLPILVLHGREGK